MEESQSLPKKRGIRLKYLRDLIHLSRRELADLINRGTSTIQYWEDGRSSGLPDDEALRLMEIFQQNGVVGDYEWLLGNGDINPVLAADLMGQEGVVGEAITNPILLEEAKVFHTLNKNTTTIIITDDAMLPFYSPGDIVGGEKYVGKAIESLFYQHCIIERSNASPLCRILRPSTNEKAYDLACTNPSSQAKDSLLFHEKIISAARVVWIRRS